MGSRTDAVKFRTEPSDPGWVPRQPTVVSSGLDSERTTLAEKDHCMLLGTLPRVV